MKKIPKTLIDMEEATVMLILLAVPELHGNCTCSAGPTLTHSLTHCRKWSHHNVEQS